MNDLYGVCSFYLRKYVIKRTEDRYHSKFIRTNTLLICSDGVDGGGQSDTSGDESPLDEGQVGLVIILIELGSIKVIHIILDDVVRLVGPRRRVSVLLEPCLK